MSDWIALARSSHADSSPHSPKSRQSRLLGTVDDSVLCAQTEFSSLEPLRACGESQFPHALL